ncbi:class II aldolase/adducin family protein [Nesterenkonia sphaerica]|uniref:Class II aldolase/adducin family protein n=1 Tax=Nesterenkonia sphaerica TaxID=1804988 RepID=A0A5R8ZXP5_9MICC|nr:class II aldolase/adducin family protein [Nesterenkonia sphaerica]TLP71213.1 class II aldolase/adducin family protein [Nesterenkonia sphaerica]
MSYEEQLNTDAHNSKKLLVNANHILYAQGVLDAFGHVSMRCGPDSEAFYLSRNIAPALVQAEDVQVFDLEGVTTDTRRPYLERYIHAAIYRARPDVGAVVHSHSLNVIPYTVAEQPLRPIMHMAGFLGEEVPVFEIRERSGQETDLLIRNNVQGDELADALGKNSTVLLMRGHGSVATGKDVKEAVFNAIYTEVNAEIQARSESLGRPVYLTPGEAKAAKETNASQIDRAWAFWLSNAVGHPHV